MRAILVLALVSTAAFAKGPTGTRMGGVGYLMPDGNGTGTWTGNAHTFNNTSQLPATMGFGAQAQYWTQKVEALDTNVSSASPSAVWGNGKFGIGAFAIRTGTSLTESGEYGDGVGGAAGLSFAGGRMSLGAGYVRGIGEGQSDDGNARADFALNAVKGTGFIFGVGASTTVNAVTTRRTANVGVGYQFAVNNSVEAFYSMNDLDDKEDNTMSGFVTLGGKMLYFGGGVNYLNPAKVTQALVRVGARLGNNVDLSAFTNYTFDDDYDPLYGGTFRVMF